MTRPRVVVVTMKTQLRGRIRRNVQTLLDMGADVTVVNAQSAGDFRLGLDDDRLEVRQVLAHGVRSWVLGRLRVLSALRGQRRARRRHPPSAAGVQPLAAQPERSALTASAVRAVTAVARLERRVVHAVLDTLLPWHRVTRWMSFWRHSRDAVVALDPHLVVSSDLPGLVGANVAARRLGVPHVHDCHELYLESGGLRAVERRLMTPVERRFMRRADAVVVVNRSIAEEYRRRYGVVGTVVRNCAARGSDDAAVEDVRPMAGLAGDATVVLYQGGFARGRGLEVVIEGAARLGPDAYLVLLGDGDYRDELERLADEVGGGRVRFVDAVPPARLPAVTRSATVGVVPYQPVTLNNRLALPNKVFEYTGCGVPVVVADAPELRAVALEHGCGAVYDPYDPAAFVAATRSVLRRRDEHAAASRRFAAENTWEAEQRRLVAVYLRSAPGIGLRVPPPGPGTPSGPDGAQPPPRT